METPHTEASDPSLQFSQLRCLGGRALISAVSFLWCQEMTAVPGIAFRRRKGGVSSSWLGGK